MVNLDVHLDPGVMAAQRRHAKQPVEVDFDLFVGHTTVNVDTAAVVCPHKGGLE